MEIFKNKTIILIWNLLRKMILYKTTDFSFFLFQIFASSDRRRGFIFDENTSKFAILEYEKWQFKRGKITLIFVFQKYGKLWKISEFDSNNTSFSQEIRGFHWTVKSKEQGLFLAISTANYKIFSGFLVWTGQPI